MVRYIVACQYIHRGYITSLANDVIKNKVELLRIARSDWYFDALYYPIIPLQQQWHSMTYLPLWDVIDERDNRRIQNAILQLEATLKNIDNTMFDEEVLQDIINWLRFWSSRQAYFVIV